jgi:hypothetical protein
LHKVDVGEIVGEVGMRLGHAYQTFRREALDDLALVRLGIGRDQAEPREIARAERLNDGEGRCRCGRAGCRGDPFAQLAIDGKAEAAALAAVQQMTSSRAWPRRRAASSMVSQS